MKKSELQQKHFWHPALRVGRLHHKFVSEYEIYIKFFIRLHIKVLHSSAAFRFLTCITIMPNPSEKTSAWHNTQCSQHCEYSFGDMIISGHIQQMLCPEPWGSSGDLFPSATYLFLLWEISLVCVLCPSFACFKWE